MSNIYTRTQQCLLLTDKEDKLKAVTLLLEDWRQGELSMAAPDDFQDILVSGVPDKPKLVKAAKLKQRKLDTPEGHATLLHAIAHIEFSAINLALDAAQRFRDMPKEYIDDWLQVADEERHHFTLLQNRLQKLGYTYGDFPAHNGLWRTAAETADDVLVRMALVPRVLEARGLDVTPSIVAKLQAIGDEESVAILDIIFNDEITHVATGTKWFRYVCKERNLDPDATFEKVVRERFYTVPRGPFHEEARTKAGFSEREMIFLNGL